MKAHFLISVSLSVMALLFLLREAQAYRFQKCDPFDSKERWEGGSTDTYHFASESFTSGEESDLKDIMDDWETVNDIDLNIHSSFAKDADGKVVYGDGVSDVALVTDDSFYSDHEPDAAGAANTVEVYDFLSGDCSIIEADIVFPESSESALEAYFAHELGHSLGMDHMLDFATLVANGGNPGQEGDHPFKPMPDDRQGLAAVYGNGKSSTDVATSEYMLDQLSDSDLEPYDSGYLNHYGASTFYQWPCPGDSIEVLVTNLNFGTSSVSARNKFYLVHPTTGAKRTIETFTTTISARSDYTRTLSMTLPRFGLDNSTSYELWGEIDSDDAVSETDETDNAAQLGWVSINSESACGGPAKFLTAPLTQVAATGHAAGVAKLKLAILDSQEIILATATRVESEKLTSGQIVTEIDLKIVDPIRVTSSSTSRTLRFHGGSVLVADDAGEPSSIEYQGFSHGTSLEQGKTYLLFLGPYAVPFVGGSAFVFEEVESGGKKFLLSQEGAEQFRYSAGKLVRKEEESSNESADVDNAGNSRVRRVLGHGVPRSRGESRFVSWVKSLSASNPYEGPEGGAPDPETILEQDILSR